MEELLGTVEDMAAPMKTPNPRHPHPEWLEDATRFTDDRHELHPLWFVKTLKAFPQWWKALREATSTERRQVKGLGVSDEEQTQNDTGVKARFGRKRMKGDWALVYLAYVVSRHPDVEPFWGTAGHSIWTEAGFKERPSYALTQLRFSELEEFEWAFLECAQKLIQRAVKRSGGRVGRYLHVDSTESETHARLKHICGKNSPCRKRKKADAKPGEVQETRESTGNYVSATESTRAVRAERHVAVEEQDPDETDVNDLYVGDNDHVEFDPQQGIVKVGDCTYEILDRTAGIRAYTRPWKIQEGKDAKGAEGVRRVVRFWVGFYNSKAIDHYTGAPVGVLLSSASINEAKSYKPLLARAIAASGVPEAVVADRGYSVAPVFQHNTEQGIASVIAWRRSKNYDDRSGEDRDDWDRHGIPRCRNCGGPTNFLSFTHKDPAGPRITFRCQMPLASCPDRQTILCSRQWRLLVPMWRNEPTYQALRRTHDRYERVHHLWRVRYRVGADDHALRPKRRGIACQQLRATVALLAEWLVILWREGWLGSGRKRRNKGQRILEDFTGVAHGFELLRRKLGLLASYGAHAVKRLGDTEIRLGPERPVPAA